MPALESIAQNSVVALRYAAVVQPTVADAKPQATIREPSIRGAEVVPDRLSPSTAASLAVLASAPVEATVENRQSALSAAVLAYATAASSGTTIGSIGLYGLSA